MSNVNAGGKGSVCVSMTPEQYHAALANGRLKPEAPKSSQSPSEGVQAIPGASGEAKRSKYGNRKTIIDGIKFDSELEAKHWGQLKFLEAQGVITDLRRQVRFYWIDRKFFENRWVEKPECYIADFVWMESGKEIVADAKGHKTEEYERKKKAMSDVRKIEIKELT